MTKQRSRLDLFLGFTGPGLWFFYLSVVYGIEALSCTSHMGDVGVDGIFAAIKATTVIALGVLVALAFLQFRRQRTGTVFLGRIGLLLTALSAVATLWVALPLVFVGACKSPETEAWRVSHETIYRSLYVQARGVLKKVLMEHLRSRRPIRRSRHATAKADQRGRIPDAVSISERPASVDDRAVPGHWEGDLLCGSKNSYIVTLVERHSRYVMLAKVPNRETQTVVDALIRQARKLPDELYKSLTWDRGKELADHKRFSMETDIDVYFCDPQSPWQRGSNENTTACCASTSPKALISRRTHRPR